MVTPPPIRFMITIDYCDGNRFLSRQPRQSGPPSKTLPSAAFAQQQGFRSSERARSRRDICATQDQIRKPSRRIERWRFLGLRMHAMARARTTARRGSPDGFVVGQLSGSRSDLSRSVFDRCSAQLQLSQAERDPASATISGLLRKARQLLGRGQLVVTAALRRRPSPPIPPLVKRLEEDERGAAWDRLRNRNSLIVDRP
jgi:hypothetical protein